MIEGLLIALLVAKIRKYKLAPLFKEWTTYPVLVLALIYLYMNFSISQGNTFFIKYASVYKIVLVLIFGLMIIKYNLYKAGFLSAALIVVGGILNNLVIKANGDRMPVFPSLSYKTGYMTHETFKNLENIDSLHTQGSSASKLAFLGDWIDVGYTIMSIGDLFIMSFVFVIIYSSIKHLNKCSSKN